MSLRGIVLVLGLVLVPGASFGEDFDQRTDVQQFIEKLCQSDGFSKSELQSVFSKAKYKQSVIDAISRPAEKVLKWDDYQDIFLTRKRIAQGRKFLLANRDALVKAQKIFGVPPVIVAAIIGVETMYGQRQGHYRVLDSLSTLAFDYPPRAAFFQQQLRQFLLMTREEHRPPEDPILRC